MTRPPRHTCPSCSLRRLERIVLPLHAPLPPVGMCVVRCAACGYELTVETRRWQRVTEQEAA